jgi:amidase
VSLRDYSQYDGLGLAELVRTGRASPRELVTAAIERIEAHNPKLNAVVHDMRHAALKLADGPLPEGPFRGVPFLLKDLVSLYAGEPTSSGSRLFRGWLAPHDSEVVRRYRAAGLIVVGKTNTPEFGLVPYTEPELFGPARNPWDITRTTGGSSGGSAAAVASGMVPMAGGGDGGGSIRVPASCCGLFGLKPTRARTPTGPDHGELWRGAVVEHVLTRSVRDSAAMLDVIAGPDTGAPYFAPPPARPYLDEVASPPGRLRIAFTVAPFLGHDVHADCRRAVADSVTLLQSLGHELMEAAPAIDRDAFNRAFLTVICGEMAADLTDARAVLGRNVTRGDVEAPTWALALLGENISSSEYSSAVRYMQRAARGIAQFFDTVDVLLTPTVAAPPFAIGALQPTARDRMTMKAVGMLRSGGLLRLLGALERAAATVFDWIPWPPLANATGQPAMSVPLSWNAEGLPIGVQFMARYADEATLFRLAGQLERAAPWKDRHPAVWT